jgi:hypothetical protein
LIWTSKTTSQNKSFFVKYFLLQVFHYNKEVYKCFKKVYIWILRRQYAFLVWIKIHNSLSWQKIQELLRLMAFYNSALIFKFTTYSIKWLVW